MQKKKHHSHGLTASQLKDLQYEQVNGEAGKITANRDSEVEINEADAHLIHVRIEAPEFDSKTGKRLSIPIIQNFYQNEFDSMDAQGAFQGKDVTIVHQPSADQAKIGRIISPNTGGTGSNEDASKQKPATQGTGEQGGNAEKPVSRMNKGELQAEYKRLYGEDAPEGAKNDELKEAIESKIEETENAKKQTETQGTGEQGGENSQV